MELGRLGVWSINDGMTAVQAAGFAQRIEAWGYGTQWLAEAAGRNVFVHASFLLAKTARLNIATGIANLYARDPMASVAARNALAEQSDGRFLLGLGVSHAPLVEGWRGQSYGKPVATMRQYLETMSRVPYGAPPPPSRPKTVIAALGPKMLELAGELADGAHPYNGTPEHTAQARAILGPDKLLCPEQMVLLETDAAAARRIGRRVLSLYLGLPNYTSNWLRLGFEEADFSGGGSDRFIDSIIAWGDEAAIRARIQAHWDAGADHVCIQSLPREDNSWIAADERVFELLAPAGGA
jgi:probable F420-dependent oxidoreductase